MSSDRLVIDPCEPTLIAGIPRSGTSLVAGIVNICGAFGGTMAARNKYNEKGMYENQFVRDQIVKPFLRGIGADPRCQSRLPDQDKVAALADDIGGQWRRRVLNAMALEGYVGGAWFYKDPKACHVWAMWNKAFPGARWLIIRRKTGDVVDSCTRTRFMNAYSTPRGWQRWAHTHLERFEEMKEHLDDNVREVWPQKIIEAEFDEIIETVEWLGLEWNEKEILDFVAPALWKKGRFITEGTHGNRSRQLRAGSGRA